VRLSTRGRYGVRAIYELATRYGKGPVPLKEIAERQAIPEHYLEQLMATLRKAGIVTSVRGAQGGYELARPPSEISVGEVVRVVEGPISLAECVGDLSSTDGCERADECAMRLLWERLRDCINRVLDSTNFEALSLISSPRRRCSDEESLPGSCCDNANAPRGA